MLPEKIPFYLHDLGQEELDSLAEVFKGPILTTGETVGHFENIFADYLGRKKALAVTSCTGALHLALIGLGIGPGDEVITTPLTFVATALAILEAGARPVFVDVEPDTGNMDASKIGKAITPKTKAILPVHLYGLMCDMREIRKIADQKGLKVIEDCAHCVEGQRDGVRPGELSEAACFSFFATKNLACGEGGALVTDDLALYEKFRLLRLHGMNKTSADRYKEGFKHWDVTVLGWKYNMDNIHAAFLIPQMKRLSRKLIQRHHLVDYYLERLKAIQGIRIPSTRENTTHARHLFTIWVDSKIRDRTIEQLGERGIQTVVNYRAIHQLTYLRENLGYDTGSFPIAETIGNETISLPFYPNMPKDHIDKVCDALRAILSENK